MLRLLAVFLTLAFPVAARADDFKTISERDHFLDLMGDKALKIGLYDLLIYVSADGSINGTALGSEITGKWAWQDGYFCREMDWSGTPISYNCQLVEVRAESAMRFTVDQGSGTSAVFRLH